MSVCGCGAKHAGSGIAIVALPKSSPGKKLSGAPSGLWMLALLGSVQSGAPVFFLTCAVTKKPDVQPGGALTGGTVRLQVSTGPAWAQAHGPTTVAGALTP